MHAELKQGFNFLKPQVEPPSVWTKVYDWVVGTARIILIVAIIGVVIAMGIRVVLDVQGNELDEQISNLESLMTARLQEETKYRDLQARINAFEAVWTSTNEMSPIINEVNKILPESANQIIISVIDDKLTITGEALNSDIDKMESALKLDQAFTNTTLARLETSGDTTNKSNIVSFNFQATISKFVTKEFIVTVTPTTTPEENGTQTDN